MEEKPSQPGTKQASVLLEKNRHSGELDLFNFFSLKSMHICGSGTYVTSPCNETRARGRSTGTYTLRATDLSVRDVSPGIDSYVAMLNSISFYFNFLLPLDDDAGAVQTKQAKNTVGKRRGGNNRHWETKTIKKSRRETENIENRCYKIIVRFLQ